MKRNKSCMQLLHLTADLRIAVERKATLDTERAFCHLVQGIKTVTDSVDLCSGGYLVTDRDGCRIETGATSIPINKGDYLDIRSSGQWIPTILQRGPAGWSLEGLPDLQLSGLYARVQYGAEDGSQEDLRRYA